MTWALIEESKESGVMENGYLVVKGTENELVKTGVVTTTYLVNANTETFDNLVLGSDALRSDPHAVKATFTDSTLLQFSPSEIEIHPTYATMSNDAIGMKVKIPKDAVPTFVFTGDSDRLSETVVPSSAASNEEQLQE